MRKSPFSWVGGKQRLVTQLQAHFPHPPIKQLVEPFVGGGSVSLNTEADSYLWCDKNDDVINVYRLLKEHKQAFIDECKSYYTAENATKERYFALRDEFNATARHTEQRGVLFVYLNKHGFNGQCRYNKKGQLNTPSGLPPHELNRPMPFDEAKFQYFVQLSDRINLFCGDFATLSNHIEEHAVVYCDPPYSLEENTKGLGHNHYNGERFSPDDHFRLTEWVKALNRDKNCHCVISNHATAFTAQLYQDFEQHFLSVKRLLCANADKRHQAQEVIAVLSSR